MKLGLCVPVTHPIGVPLLRVLAEMGFDHARFNLHTDDHDLMRLQLNEWRDLPELRPLVLVGGAKARRYRTGAPWSHVGLVNHCRDVAIKLRDLGLLEREMLPVVEVVNEPDLADDRWKENAQELGKVFRDCFCTIRELAPGVLVLSPSVSNLNSRGFRYLEAMVEDPGLPEDCGVAVHRYPAGRGPTVAHEGFSSRRDEVSRLYELIGDRPVWVTETGYAEWEQEDGRVSEDYVADYLEADLRFWDEQRADAVTIYQLNSDRWAYEADYDEKRLKTYGIRTIEGKWKPLATRIPQLAQEFDG